MFSVKTKSDSRKKDKCPALKKYERFVPSKRYVGIPNQTCLCGIPIGISTSNSINECVLCGEIRLWKPLPLQIRHKKFNIFSVGTTDTPQISVESIKPEVKKSEKPSSYSLTENETEIKELFIKPSPKVSQQSANSKKFFPAVPCVNYCYCPCPYPKIPR